MIVRGDRRAAREQRFDDEARLLSDQSMSAEARLYGGEVTSPRELQALQADIEQLKRRQRTIEDRQLAAMEERGGAAWTPAMTAAWAEALGAAAGLMLAGYPEEVVPA